jgi:hypothetical protein
MGIIKIGFLLHFYPHAFNRLPSHNLQSYHNGQTLIFQGLEALMNISTAPNNKTTELFLYIYS